MDASKDRTRVSTGGVRVKQTRAGTSFAIRYRVGGVRQYETLGVAAEGWTIERAEQALADWLAAVRLGVWKPAREERAVDSASEEPTFHMLASEWVERRRRDLQIEKVWIVRRLRIAELRVEEGLGCIRVWYGAIGAERARRHPAPAVGHC